MNLKKKVINSLSRHGYRLSQLKNDYYYTWHERPKYAKDYHVRNTDFAKAGIVIQGRLFHNDDFTLETVKLYKKLFPVCPVIVSTWSTEDHRYLERMRQEGADIVVTEPPPVQEGFLNNNLQRLSSLEGIKRAKEKYNVEYVCKTRSDERIYGELSISYMIRMLEQFPLSATCKANKRILATSRCSFRYRRYNVSDVLVFGNTADMLRYWSPPYDKRPHMDIIEKDDVVEYVKQRPGEIYFSSHYLESIGHELAWTEEDSDYCFRHFFIIIDAESLDLYFSKYTDQEYWYRKYKGGALTEISFREWLSI